MKNEPSDIAGKSFEELVRRSDGSIITAAERAPKRRPRGANFAGGLGVPELRKKIGQILEPAEGEGEG